MARPSLDASFIATARVWAARSTCSSRHAVGCVIVSPQQRVIATGYNGAAYHQLHCDDVGCKLDSDGHCVRAVHAEMNAILSCALAGVSTLNATLYSTISPCFRCAQCIIQSGIAEVVYEEEYAHKDDADAASIALYNSGISYRRYS